MAVEREAQVKQLLGSDYEAYLEFIARQEAKALQRKAKELATAMVSEGGKYAHHWGNLNDQLDAIWEKAMAEANKQAGIVVETETPAPATKPETK